MKNIKKFLLIPLFAIVCMFARIDSARAETVPGVTYPFSVTTSSIAANGTFEFKLSAKGTFYVDCGVGGTLSGTGVSGGTITKNDTTEYTYTCTYSTSGSKTIQFGGVATGYGTSSTAAIGFNTSTAKALISSISGDLSAIFPYKSATNGYFPRFWETFMGCTGLTSIPANLFQNITGSGDRMFYETFSGCTGLTSIPETLFNFGGNNVPGQAYMFEYTFYGCTGLTSIPANLFQRITSVSAAYELFMGTFRGCTGLTSIPETLFNFGGNNVSGQQSMFSYTFYGCTGITSIPANLFQHITSGAASMFAATFRGCTGLTSLPKNLFANITTNPAGMFNQTFYGCTGLTGYIPPSMFAGLIANGSPSNQMSQTFYNTGLLATSCPSGTTQYTTGYESYWDSHVSCLDATPITCSSGYYLPAGLEACVTCPSGYMCSGGTFGFNATTDQGKVISIALTWYDGDTTISGPNACAYGGVFLSPTPPARTGFVFNGWKKIVRKCGMDSLNTSTSGRGTSYVGYTRLNGSAGSKESNYGLTVGSGQWATEFSYGTVWGMSNCNSTTGTANTAGIPTLASSGSYCWCQAIGFTASGNSYTSGPQCTTSSSSSWVYQGTSSTCLSGCASSCASAARGTAAFRVALFGAAGQ